MRVAITTNVLSIPPNYFVVEHAQRLSDRHDFGVFALLADVRDASVSVAIRDFAALSSAPAALRKLAAPFAGKALSKGVVQFGPDVIHQHFATWSSPAIAAAEVTGAPLVVTLHGYDVRSLSGARAHPMQRWHRREVRASARKARLVLSVSRYLADEAIAAGFDPTRLEVHYQGVDTDYFTPGSRGSHSDSPVVSFVGALEPHKGPLDLVTASVAIAGRFEHRLVMLGSGSLERELREVAREHPHIEVAGKVSRSRVREVLRASSLMVLPSRRLRGGAEAAGLVLLEAQSCGTPVIAYDVGGTSEMMRSGETGFLVPEGDREALAAEMRELLGLSDPERERIASQARDFVVGMRSLSNSCRELDSHYEKLTR